MVEMSCGWAKLEIHSANMNVSSGVNRAHKLRLHGGSFSCASSIRETDIRNDTRSSGLSFRKLKQALSGLESTVRIHETSYSHLRAKDRVSVQWVPCNAITPMVSCTLIRLYYELVADGWLRNHQIFEFERELHRQRLCETLLLFIVDRPNLLCVLCDEWKQSRDALWRSQKKDRKVVAEQLSALLRKFVPLLVHRKLSEQSALAELQQERIAFVRQIVRGDTLQVLSAKKPSASVPLIYTPFSTTLFAT